MRCGWTKGTRTAVQVGKDHILRAPVLQPALQLGGEDLGHLHNIGTGDTRTVLCRSRHSHELNRRKRCAWLQRACSAAGGSVQHGAQAGTGVGGEARASATVQHVCCHGSQPAWSCGRTGTYCEARLGGVQADERSQGLLQVQLPVVSGRLRRILVVGAGRRDKLQHISLVRPTASSQLC